MNVTGRISQVKQPQGGYIKPSQFIVTELNDNNVLSETENVHATVIGMAVDYLTRFMMGTEVKKAFEISCLGAECAVKLGNAGAIKEAKKYLSEIKGLDNNSIINACKMVTFDVCYRNPMSALMAKNASETNPDNDTVNNIKIMVERSIAFWKDYGPITKDGFTFEDKGYTSTVNSGDGDYLTEDTLWDFKVSKSKPTNKHTLQLLMYWIMGQHSEKKEFKNITKLGIFNPRLNVVYTLRISDVPSEVIKEVEDDVICY
jgi:hypothetical protein